MKENLEKIYELTLEEIMGDRFGQYSKSIIQDRALPDVRDGLKPVQRRILYGMYEDKNTYDKEYKKSAKAVGLVMGSFHPHGDSSIYEAMIRMSQKWKMRETFIDIQGNNGSIDGDGPAAMRYTEARLTKLANVMLKDINKNSVEMAPTFDDTALEPTVLPANFPNLLVNGSNGISAGYATNIPPHNLGEIIDATIKRIDNPNCRLDTILEIVKGPDFPTGGIVEGKENLKNAYTTGKGKVVVKSKYEIEKVKGKEQIVITEIPYDVVKSSLIKKIEDIRIDKKIDGIVEVRDESDKNDLVRIVIELKKGANKELIINYLLKNTDMQVNFNYNVVAIINRRPKTLGILEILDAFIEHKKSVVLRRSKYDLEVALNKKHITEGLVRAISILDEIVKLIRASKNKKDAKDNLIKTYDFTEIQAEAIVMMQLYKLTNTDVTLLMEELDSLNKLIDSLNNIINNEEVLKKTMKEELKEIKREFATSRLTEIKDEITEIKIDTTQMINKDDYIVYVTNDGYIKKVSMKSYNSNEEETPVKEGDFVTGEYKINNLDVILLFTNKGNFLYVPVHVIPEVKYKDLGKHISSIVKVSDGERIVKSVAIYDFDNNDYVTCFTKQGMVKRIDVNSFKLLRYSKPVTMFKLKDDDELIDVSIIQGTDVILTSSLGYALKYNIEEIPVQGLKTSGVKGINLKDSYLLSGIVINSNNDYLTIFTDKLTAKRIKISDIEATSRAKKGSLVLKSPKSKKYNITNIFSNNSKDEIGLIHQDEVKYIKISEINIMDKQSVGSSLHIKNVKEIFTKTKLKNVKELEHKEKQKEEIIEEKIIESKEEEKKQEPEEKQVEKKYENMTMSDFFNDFKI